MQYPSSFDGWSNFKLDASATKWAILRRTYVRVLSVLLFASLLSCLYFIVKYVDVCCMYLVKEKEMHPPTNYQQPNKFHTYTYTVYLCVLALALMYLLYEYLQLLHCCEGQWQYMVATTTICISLLFI